MPVLNGLQMALDALGDCLAQTVPTKILIINQGADDATRTGLEQASEADPERVFVWSHQPPLPSLAATWNRALRFVWACGGEEALVVNHDIRLHPHMLQHLCDVRQATDAYFVSGVAVDAESFQRYCEKVAAGHAFCGEDAAPGGPSFSCFLISKACHWQYPFDEAFVPAYCEDADLHRRMMLGGDGARIFSINVPFLHYGSQVLKTLEPKARQGLERQIGTGSRAHYAKKWGGGVNQEIFRVPFDPASAVTDGSATTPALQQALQARQAAPESTIDDPDVV